MARVTFPALSIAKLDDQRHVSIGSDRPATLDDVTKFAKAIQAGSPVQVGIIQGGAIYGVHRL